MLEEDILKLVPNGQCGFQWLIKVLYHPSSFHISMGKVDKGVACSVQGCDQIALRSMSGSKAAMAIDLMVDSSSKRIYLCRQHYKDWKKATKEDRENERARWD
jgi:hypothetical protein